MNKPTNKPINKPISKLLVSAFVVCGLILSTGAQAQLHVDISGVGANQIPIAIASFADETLAPAQVSAIIKADLARSGFFKVIDTGGVMSETSAVNCPTGERGKANWLPVHHYRLTANRRRHRKADQQDMRLPIAKPIDSAPEWDGPFDPEPTASLP